MGAFDTVGQKGVIASFACHALGGILWLVGVALMGAGVSDLNTSQGAANDGPGAFYWVSPFAGIFFSVIALLMSLKPQASMAMVVQCVLPFLHIVSIILYIVNILAGLLLKVVFDYVCLVTTDTTIQGQCDELTSGADLMVAGGSISMVACFLMIIFACVRGGEMKADGKGQVQPQQVQMATAVAEPVA